MEFDFDVESKRFERWIDTFISQVPEAQETALRKLALTFLREVILRTPVDTGRARGGWESFLLEGGKRATASKASRELHKARGRKVRGGTSGRAQGQAEGSYRTNFTGRDQFVEIINGVPYIVRLEYGWSDQAPGGMVRVAFRVLSAKQEVDKAFLDALEDAIAEADRKAGRG
jgi:hypothetical protein